MGCHQVSGLGKGDEGGGRKPASTQAGCGRGTGTRVLWHRQGWLWWEQVAMAPRAGCWAAMDPDAPMLGTESLVCPKWLGRRRRRVEGGVTGGEGQPLRKASGT